MFTTRRVFRENGATTPVCMAAISSTLLLLGRMVTAMLRTEGMLMLLSLLWATLYLLQRVLVGKRRSSGHWLVQYGAMAAYYLPSHVALFAASTLYYYTSYKESCFLLMCGILTMFYFTILMVPSQSRVLFTNMRAYSLRDRQGDRYSFLKWLVFLVFVEWEWARITSSNWQGPEPLIPLSPMIIHFFVALVILFVNTSESTLDCQTKEVADYMKRESSKSSSASPSTSPFFDDDDANSNSSMQLLDCCRYPFVQGKKEQWISIKDLFHLCGDLSSRDKDICVSYSLSRLLARRYYGFHCAEEGGGKVRRFVLADLGTTDGSYKRAFSIVEVQLAFLHDYFFTASLPILKSGWCYIACTQQVSATFTYTILTFLLAIPSIFSSIDERGMIQMLAMVGLAIPPKVHGRPLASYWRPIHTAFGKLNYLPVGLGTSSILVRLFRFLMRLFHFSSNFDPCQLQTGGASAYWRNKIGQYSILQDYDRRLSPRKELVAWFQQTMLSQSSYEFIKHLPVEEEVDMKNLDSMRKLVAKTLRAIDGPPTNGTRSLKINMDKINRDERSRGGAGYDWLLTCKQKTHTDTILIWHIATCYCDMSLRHSRRAPEQLPRLAKTDTYHRVATTLSRYCAYLVAFLPEFLPEHILATKQVFQRVLEEAQGALGTTPMEEKDKYTNMALLQPQQHEQEKTFHKGVELGRQLEALNDDKLRWKVMAKFWAETILYLAPSDNAEAHIEHLAKGGEFITHLWAMLSNAGILKRATGEWHPPPASTTIEGPTTHQPMEALSSSIDEASTSDMSSPPRQTSEPPTNE